MITRLQILRFLDIVITVVSDVRDIVSVCPSYPSLLHHLEMFRDFLKKEYKDQN